MKNDHANISIKTYQNSVVHKIGLFKNTPKMSQHGNAVLNKFHKSRALLYWISAVHSVGSSVARFITSITHASKALTSINAGFNIAGAALSAFAFLSNLLIYPIELFTKKNTY